jgi:hypothetical protein
MRRGITQSLCLGYRERLGAVLPLILFRGVDLALGSVLVL